MLVAHRKQIRPTSAAPLQGVKDILGTAAANPIVSAGHHGQPWQESLAAAGFLNVTVSIIAASLLVL
jgi:hypothetical protein